MSSQDLTTGNISKQVWSLAWPLMLSFLFQVMYNFVDAAWVSQLSEDANSAVTISQVSLFIMLSLGLGITVGSGVLISMNIGAKNKDEAERVLGQAFVLAALLAVTFTTFALVFHNELLRASGAAGTIFPLAVDYFLIVSAGSILIFFLIVVVFAFNSQGDTKTVTVLYLTSTTINAILDPVLIFGWVGFPALGIKGAAIATLFSQFIMLVIGLIILSRPDRVVQFHWKNLGIKWQSVRKVMSIGFPAAITQVLNPILLATIFSIIQVKFLEAGANGYAAGFRVENFAFLPGIGFGTAAMAMVGQNIGARNWKRAEQSRKKALLFAFIAGSGLGVISMVLSKATVGFLNLTNLLSINYAVTYLLSVPLTYGILSMLFVNVSTLQGTGKSWPGFFINLTQNSIIVGVSALLVFLFDAPIYAIWGAIILGRIIGFLLSRVLVLRRFENLRNEAEDVSEFGLRQEQAESSDEHVDLVGTSTEK